MRHIGESRIYVVPELSTDNEQWINPDFGSPDLRMHYDNIRQMVKEKTGRAMQYHEMDLAHFVERLDELWNQHYPETNLKRIRDLAGLSQRELAELSGVSVRQIQLFEQRQRDINQTRAIDVLRLSRALGCKNEDLLEL